MKRAKYAAGFVVILLIVGAFLFPRMQGNAAIADVMRAMASVKTCHFTGSTVDEDGNRVQMEGWFKSPDRMRVRHGDLYESFLVDGKEITVEQDKVTINKSDIDPQSIFVGGLLRRAASMYSFFTKVDVEKTVLPNGREVLVLTAHEKQEHYTGTTVFTIDRATDLMVSIKVYDRNNRLTTEISEFQYDKPIPDSVLAVEMPDGLPVVDLRAHPSEEKLAWRQKEMQRLAQSHARLVISLDCGAAEAPYHPGYRFGCMDAGKLRVYFMQDEHVYRVLGRAYVQGPDGYLEIVEDDDIRLPGEPEIRVVLMKDGAPGASCSLEKTGLTQMRVMRSRRLVNIGQGPLTVTWDKAREVFTVEGKAKLLPTGDVFDDGTYPGLMLRKFDPRTLE